jgi:predicted DNA-binding protein (UPF0278 family)
MSNDIIVIDTPAGMDHFRLCQHIAALRIEVNTGMRHSQGSVMKSAKQAYGIQKQTKAGVLGELEKLYRATYGREYGRQTESEAS